MRSAVIGSSGRSLLRASVPGMSPNLRLQGGLEQVVHSCDDGADHWEALRVGHGYDDVVGFSCRAQLNGVTSHRTTVTEHLTLWKVVGTYADSSVDHLGMRLEEMSEE